MGRKEGRIPGEGERGEEVGESEYGDRRSEEADISAFKTTGDDNRVRGIEGVEVEGSVQTSKGILGVEFNGRFVRSGGLGVTKLEQVMV